MKVTLGNGLTVDGDRKLVEDAIRKMGYSLPINVYYSETRGPILIESMHVNHVKNALLKEYGRYMDAMKSEYAVAKFVDGAIRGPNNDVANALINELKRRQARGTSTFL